MTARSLGDVFLSLVDMHFRFWYEARIRITLHISAMPLSGRNRGGVTDHNRLRSGDRTSIKPTSARKWCLTVGYDMRVVFATDRHSSRANSHANTTEASCLSKSME